MGCVGPVDHRPGREPRGGLQRWPTSRAAGARLVVGAVGEVGEAHALRRVVADAGPRFAELDVGFVDPESMGGHRDDLLAQYRARLVDRAGRHRPAAAALGAGPVRRHRGVALDRGDVVDVGTERVGGQLDHGGLDAVAARTAVHVDVDLAGRLHADRRALGAEMAGRRAGRLDVGREAESDVAALRQRVGLLLAEALMVEDLHGLLEGVGRGDMVVRHAVGVEVRHLVAAQDVAAAQLDGIDVDLARRDVEKYFPREGFVLPGSAVGGEPGGVREHRLVVEAGLRHAVRARGRTCRSRRWSTPGTASDTPRRPGRSRCRRPGCCRPRRMPSGRRRRHGGPARPTSGSRAGPRSTSAPRAPCGRPA